MLFVYRLRASVTSDLTFKMKIKMLHIPRVTVKLHVSKLPASSVAVHVTELCPFGKEDPEMGWQNRNIDVSKLSKASGSGQVTGLFATVKSAGQVIDGFSVSVEKKVRIDVKSMVGIT